MIDVVVLTVVYAVVIIATHALYQFLVLPVSLRRQAAEIHAQYDAVFVREIAKIEALAEESSRKAQQRDWDRWSA